MVARNLETATKSANRWGHYDESITATMARAALAFVIAVAIASCASILMLNLLLMVW